MRPAGDCCLLVFEIPAHCVEVFFAPVLRELPGGIQNLDLDNRIGHRMDFNILLVDVINESDINVVHKDRVDGCIDQHPPFEGFPSPTVASLQEPPSCQESDIL